MELDIKTIKHAKDYIDSLARGVNPLTLEAVGDDDVINNIRISRCLLYVSDVLEEVIENGGVKKKSKPQENFDIQRLDMNSFEYFAEPVSITEFAKRINEMKPETMKKLKVTAITNWLVDVDMLSIIQMNGKNHKRPTKNGEGIGIILEQRNGHYGPYYAVLYNENAQHFIIDNISSIIEGGYNG
ncbi:MAG: hypothetical protein E7570_03920 [Ruminococcaceae bacterium]|nr:hypothetical protein [Oscillospiraceae bacterium]